MPNFSPLVRRVFTLLSGTIMAQVVSFLLLPVISRLYLPAEIGISEAFIAVVMLMVVGINGGFEMAMMLPREEEMVQRITKFAFYISLFLCVGLGMVLGLFGKGLIEWLHQSELRDTYLWLPLVLFLEGGLQLLRYYFMRHNELRAISVGKVFNILGRNGLSIVFAYGAWGYQGLIGAFVLGQVANLLPYLYVMMLKRLPAFDWKFEMSDYRGVWDRYGDFPKYGMVSTWLNTAGKQLPYFLFPVYFLSADTLLGHYAFACKILGIPLVLTFIVGDIFYKRASELGHEATDELYHFTVKTTLFLSGFAVVPYLVLYFLGHVVFNYFLDAKYWVAGEYAEVLAPYFFSLFVSIPLTYLIDVRMKLREYLVMNFVFLMIRAAVVVICGGRMNEMDSIFYFSWVGTLLNLVQIGYCIYISRNKG